MKKLLVSLLPIAIVLCLFSVANAADTNSSTLPYESWLRTIQKSLTGTVAFSIAMIGVVTAGATLILGGGEIGKFTRALVYIVLVMTLLTDANTLVANFFNGATIELNVPANDTEIPPLKAAIDNEATHNFYDNLNHGHKQSIKAQDKSLQGSVNFKQSLSLKELVAILEVDNQYAFLKDPKSIHYFDYLDKVSSNHSKVSC